MTVAPILPPAVAALPRRMPATLRGARHLAVLSGKGGAGKTTIATAMAALLHQRGRSVAYLDCDVEEPNGDLYLKPAWEATRIVQVPTPRVDEGACRQAGVCGQCDEACQFNAIVRIGEVIVVNDDLCHGCGACALACPARAITETPCRVGDIAIGQADGITCVTGRLDVGRPMATPVIRQVKSALIHAPSIRGGTRPEYVILDAPPGVACPAVETARGADLAILIIEATPFGFNDARLAAEMLALMALPAAAVLNRADAPVDDILDWCASRAIPVLGVLRDDRRVAEAFARGSSPVLEVPAFRDAVAGLLDALESLPQGVRS